MTYDVIARKWRPRSFGDVIGQEPVVRTLSNAIRTGRIHHSLIFAGLRGTGKTSTARIFAKALNCQEGPTAEPCLKCVACDEIARGIDVDVFEIDAASNKGVDDIRDLKEIVKFPPTRDRYKIFIIDEAHMLSSHAFNALLKTIEEPPPYVVFILATTEVHKIPPTIRSRCQLYEFKRIGNSEIRSQLERIVEQECVQVTGDALDMITDASEGSMRDAESILDQIISFSGDSVQEEDVAFVLGIPNSRVHLELLRAIAGSDVGAVVDILDELESKNTDFVRFTARFGDYLQEALHALIRGETDLFGDVLDAGQLSREDVVRYLNILLQGERSVRDAFSQRIALELILMKMAFAGHVVPITELLTKKKTINSDNPAGSIEAHPAANDIGAPVTDVEKPSTDHTAPTSSALDEEQTEEPDVNPDEVYRTVMARHTHLSPFLNKSELKVAGNEVEIRFDSPVPEIIRGELESGFRDDLGRALGRATKTVVKIRFVYDEPDQAPSERDRLQEHPVVKAVLDTFDGEIEAITDKENGHG